MIEDLKQPNLQDKKYFNSLLFFLLISGSSKKTWVKPIIYIDALLTIHNQLT